MAVQARFYGVIVLVTWALALAATSAMAQRAFEAETSVTLESGPIEGDLESGLRVFRGIPYATPPLGDLRWRAPKPPAPWTTVRETLDFGPACPQTASKSIAIRNMSEDCLTLNVWAPGRAAASGPVPVMVWVHGGGFDSGSARMRIYDGANLAEKGVIVVTFNYRLGYLGFFGHPQLTQEARAENAFTANYGLLDQIAALQWVKRNIAAFGGDPHNVTLFGESAGAISIMALMTAPSARGLFHKAIVQSGGGRWTAPTLTTKSGVFAAAHDYGERAAQTFGFAPDAALKGLRSQSWEEILGRLGAVPELFNRTPFLDGQLLPDQIEPVFMRGQQAPIPMIVGANSYEGVLLRGAFKVSADRVFKAVGSQLDDLTELYPPQLIMTRDTLADHIWGDANFVEPARMIARAASRTGQPVYHYNFDFQPPLLRLLGGSPHGLEVAYAFGTIKNVVPFPLANLMHPHNREVSRRMMIYWTTFAKTGDPSARGLAEWPRFSEQREDTLVFGNRGVDIEQDHLKQRLDLFKGVIW